MPDLTTLLAGSEQAAPVPETSILYGVNDPSGTPADIVFTIATLRTTVLGSPSALISDPSGGATVDAEARTAINAIIDALQAANIVATS